MSAGEPRRWRVRIRRVSHGVVEVEAPNEDAALSAVDEMTEDDAYRVDWRDDDWEARGAEQVSGPPVLRVTLRLVGGGDVVADWPASWCRLIGAPEGPDGEWWTCGHALVRLRERPTEEELACQRGVLPRMSWDGAMELVERMEAERRPLKNWRWSASEKTLESDGATIAPHYLGLLQAPGVEVWETDEHDCLVGVVAGRVAVVVMAARR